MTSAPLDNELTDPRDLEHIADAILAEHGALGRTNGIYTQAQLDRKMRLEYARLPRMEEHGVPDEVIDYLVERQVHDLVEVSGLSPVQETLYRLHISGLTCTDIAATLDIKRSTIRSHLRKAIWKVRLACKEGRYAGWYEVYLSEVNRPACRTRRP